MATRTWNPVGNTGAFATAGNWVEGVAPVGGDDLDFRLGTADLVTGTDQSAVNFGKVHIYSGFTGRLGNSTADPFLFGCASCVIDGGGSNVLYIGSGAAPGNDIEKLQIKGAGPNRAAPINVCAGTVVNMVMEAGNVNLIAGTITRLVAKAVAGSGYANIINTAATITLLEMLNGYVQQISTGTITEARQVGGFLKVDAGTMVTLRMLGAAAKCEWNSTTAAITTLQGIGGMFDMGKSIAARTITNSEFHNGFMFDDPNNVAVFTNDYVRYGGTINRSTPPSESYVP